MSSILTNGIRFASKEYPKLNDDELYDLVCNLHYQIQHRLPTGPMWLEYMLQQWPQDLISYQRILWQIRPELIMEMGTGGGGCTLFFASILDLMKVENCKIVTVDLPSNQPNQDILNHPHIVYIQGNNESVEVIEKIKSYWSPSKTTILFLDSAHDSEHVSKEMEAYGPLVSVGSYMVVEDTYLGYSTYCGDHGPMASVDKWIREHDNWVVDHFFDEWMITQNPCGYLRRMK